MKSRAERLITSGVLTGVIDGAFSSFLAAVVYGSTVTRLFQRVASALLGPAALEGGGRTALIGVLMHFGVAFGWSAVFLLLYERSAAIRRATSTAIGTVATAAIYGPMIWVVMSLMVLPLLTRQPPAMNLRWLIQLIGHFPFVALPIVSAVSANRSRTTA